MNSTRQKSRSEIPAEYKWDLESMYPDEQDFYRDIESALDRSQELAACSGHVMDSASSLLKALLIYTGASRLIEKAYAYAHMRRDEDNADSGHSAMFGKAASAITQFSAAASFLEPEILASEPALIADYIDQEEGLGVYRFMLYELIKRREHTLSSEQEMIIASYGEVLRSSDDIFSALSYTDLDFGTVTDTDGNEKPLTLSSYITFMESPDRSVRRQAYEKLFGVYKAHNNTLAATYSSNVRKDAVTARLRRYPSSLEAALDPGSIPVSVYDNLVAAVHDHLPAMHKYVGIRKRAMGLEELAMYDVYAPLAESVDRRFSYEEAVDLCCRALAPMGSEYVDVFLRGITTDRWVDIYENSGKTSGAYSYGSYDSKPFILLNFSGALRDVFTLIHEGGHSMHAYYTRSNQPYIYGDHSIFTAEVASTVNEMMLMNYLLANADSPEMESYLINFYIDEFKGTVFRQTMFAEFERSAHEYVEAGNTLTTDWLNNEYRRLNTEYFGPKMTQDDFICYEWSRIPHFYSSFYVYQYATGFSAANAIAGRILAEGDAARDEYIEFLKSGSSSTPIELLKIAGVDMSTEGPVDAALDTFDQLVDRLDAIIAKSL